MIIQIKQPSIPLIAAFNYTSADQLSLLSFTETTSDHVIPIDFYVGDCDKNQIEEKTIDIHGAFFPTSSNQIYEQYTLFSTVLTFQIQLRTLNSSTLNLDCAANFLAFDDVREYTSFLTNGTWSRSFKEFCVQGNGFTTNITLVGSTYYYFGLYLPSDQIHYNEQLIIYRVTGTTLRYLVDSFTFACSITSIHTTNCDINLSDLNVAFSTGLRVCIVGSVLQRATSAVPLQAIVNTKGQSKLVTNTISATNTSFLSVMSGSLLMLILVTSYITCLCIRSRNCQKCSCRFPLLFRKKKQYVDELPSDSELNVDEGYYRYQTL